MASKLRVPANITLRKEVWKGFGVKEAVITAVATLIMVFFAYVYVCFLNPGGVMIATFGVMFFCSGCIMFLSKMENNLSPVDIIRIWMNFKKQQQNFRYIKKEEVLYYVKEKD